MAAHIPVFVIKDGRTLIALNARGGKPADNVCQECGAVIEVGAFPFCKGDPAKHEPAGSRKKFEEFEIELDGQVHRITSLQDANRIERESMARYNSFDKNGKRLGAPLVFRGFHQNYSNRDVNALKGVGQESQPMQAPRNSQGLPLGRFGAVRRRD